jgi:hypothetical protein
MSVREVVARLAAPKWVYLIVSVLAIFIFAVQKCTQPLRTQRNAELFFLPTLRKKLWPASPNPQPETCNL